MNQNYVIEQFEKKKLIKEMMGNVSRWIMDTLLIWKKMY